MRFAVWVLSRVVVSLLTQVIAEVELQMHDCFNGRLLSLSGIVGDAAKVPMEFFWNAVFTEWQAY